MEFYGRLILYFLCCISIFLIEFRKRKEVFIPKNTIIGIFSFILLEFIFKYNEKPKIEKQISKVEKQKYYIERITMKQFKEDGFYYSQKEQQKLSFNEKFLEMEERVEQGKDYWTWEKRDREKRKKEPRKVWWKSNKKEFKEEDITDEDLLNLTLSDD